MVGDPVSVLIIGGGPAGLRAAEVAAETGTKVIVCDTQRSPGRKFLIAGRGGLNLTHSEPLKDFPARYCDEPQRWRDLLSQFSPDELREWVHGLGVDTYVGTSGRIFPRGQKAAALLRAWLERLRTHGVEFRMGQRLQELRASPVGWCVRFETTDGMRELTAAAVVLALGGASYPETGSDGRWPVVLAAHGIEITPWSPANCGWEVDWPQEFLARAEGMPLKNLAVTAGNETVSGELLITRYGLEGGAIYRLGHTLRTMPEPRIEIDLKPQLSADVLLERSEHLTDKGDWFAAWKLNDAAIALAETFCVDLAADREQLIARIKKFPLALKQPRPIAEAISSAGGVAWRELDDDLMLRRLPGVFVAGEMIDWEAPTGGYLLQGCFSTGTQAGKAAARYAFARGASA
ncbi:MAG: TIGR03862 family flavoprotein [Chthoniobacterales bacterium]